MARERKKAKLKLPGGHIDDKGKLHTVCEYMELDHNVDRDMADKSVTTVQLVTRHVLSIGSYKDREYIEKAVPKLAKGDFDWILIQLRVLSLGANYEYPAICPKTGCKFEGTFDHDLDRIELIEMPDPFARQLSYTTDDGIVLVFRELIAEDMEYLAEILDTGGDQISRMLALLLESIDNVTIEASLKKKFQKLKSGDWQKHVGEAVLMMKKAEINQREKEDIRVRLREQRGYPDRRIRARCPKVGCGTDFSHLLPIDYDFIAPSLGDQTQRGTL